MVQEVEQAKLEEEKRRELHELRRLQEEHAPKRQQHAEFQESPDLPLPSPGRFSQSPLLTARGQGGQNRVSYKDGDIRRTRAEDPAQHYQDRTHRDAFPPSAPAEFNPAAVIARAHAQRVHRRSSSPPTAGSNPGSDQAQTRLQEFTGEGDTRRDAFDTGHGRGSCEDVVPRADFDELSSLCRELLLEQKQLRKRLEESEQRSSRFCGRAEQQSSHRRKSGTSAGTSTGTSQATANPFVRGQGRAAHQQRRVGDVGDGQAHSHHGRGPRRQGAGSKAGVAFGSTVAKNKPSKRDNGAFAQAGAMQVTAVQKPLIYSRCGRCDGLCYSTSLNPAVTFSRARVEYIRKTTFYISRISRGGTPFAQCIHGGITVRVTALHPTNAWLCRHTINIVLRQPCKNKILPTHVRSEKDC